MPPSAPSRPFNGPYEGQHLRHVSFPIGGLGAGMFCLDGTGAFSHFSVRHRPGIFKEYAVFSAISIKGGKDQEPVARVLEGPVPDWKYFVAWDRFWDGSAMGGRDRSFGLPRFDSAKLDARFPFAEISLKDGKIPLEVSLTGWSPFVPGDVDNSSLPVGVIEYRFKNPTSRPIEAIYSFHAKNFMALQDDGQRVTKIPSGFVLQQDGTDAKLAMEGKFAAWVDSSDARVNSSWFRSGWSDAMAIVWLSIERGEIIEQGDLTKGKPSPGGSVYVPLTLAPGEEKNVRLNLGWRVPYSDVREGWLDGDTNPDPKTGFFRPWYAERFKTIEDLVKYWSANKERLRKETRAFTDCFYDSTLPPEVLEAISANLTILKSPTVLRQFDGRMWAWEGCQDDGGSCHGTCTHVWNYAQAMPHLFPALERGLRETEFNVAQDERGHQNFRGALPIGPTTHGYHAASDGQLGGLIKVYRDWRISGDLEWVRSLWPQMMKSLHFCIEHWDPDHKGVLVEPHHNTYDIEFWGPDGMCSSFYLNALQAAIEMGKALGEDVSFLEKLRASGKEYVEQELFNGEYFIQKIEWKGTRAGDPAEKSRKGLSDDYSPEAIALLDKEGPKYQYGDGCLADGVLGEWMGWAAGGAPVLDQKKIESHLRSVFKYNILADIGKYPTTMRPSYAFGHEPGLLLCTWPKSTRLSLPFTYSDEDWTGVDYHVAAHLIAFGHVEEGLEIVRMTRSRYTGALRNPFDEIECGHWYARAMSSYALLQALTGARYDAVEKTLYLKPVIKGDFRSFLSTATGYGTVGIKNGQPFLEVKSGRIDVERIVAV
jgi:uncharacterized protein (DUF608 family)